MPGTPITPDKKEGATPREILARESRAWPWRG